MNGKFVPGKTYVDESLRMDFNHPAGGICTELSLRVATSTNIPLMTDKDDDGRPVYADFDPARLEVNA